jgi:hypothetical protein
MRLQRATTISRLRGEPDDFGRMDPEEREERRDHRKRRRRRRRGQRRSRQADRSRRRADRLEEDRPRRRRRREGARPEKGRPERGRPEKGRPDRRPRKQRPEPHEPWADEAALEPAPDTWESSWEQPEVLDVDWEEVDEPEWMGAARGAQLPARWSPPAKMGSHMRIQAAQGHRAAVIALRPGLFLVAELPERVARSEFGVAAILAPLVVKAASKAIQLRQQTDPTQRPLYELLHRGEGQGQGQVQAQDRQGQPLRRLFQRPDGQLQDERGQLLYRVLHPKQAQAQAQAQQQAQAPQPAAPQLPMLQPASGSGQNAHMLLPPPELGWADEILIEPMGVQRG